MTSLPLRKEKRFPICTGQLGVAVVFLSFPFMSAATCMHTPDRENFTLTAAEYIELCLVENAK